MLVLVSGGARSGKSRFALERAMSLGERRGFVATAEVLDDGMRERVDAHRDERGDRFETVEAPRDLAGALKGMEHDSLLVDCLTLWTSNLLLDELDEPAILRRCEDFLARVRVGTAHVVCVTNEVGSGVVPATSLGRAFRDVAGRVNQRVAAAADEVWLVSLGIPLRLKPHPPVTFEGPWSV